MPKYHPQDPVLEHPWPKLFSSMRECHTHTHTRTRTHTHMHTHTHTHTHMHTQRKSRVQKGAKFSNHFHVILNIITQWTKNFFSILILTRAMYPIDLHQLWTFVTKTVCMKAVGHKICQAMLMQVHVFLDMTVVICEQHLRGSTIKFANSSR